MMTVAELIELLQQHDSDMSVVVAGYEGGYHDLSFVQPVPLVLNVHEEWYYGAHETVNPGKEGVMAISLSGRNHLAEES